MRRTLLVAVGVLLLAACGGDDDEPIVIQTRIAIAAESGAEPIATGEILEGSMLGSSPFCVGGTVVDSHANRDPAVEAYGLIDRSITCEDGTVRVAFTPGEAQGLTQPGSWTIASGTGAFERLRGSGKMETAYDPDDDSLAHETLTGTVTR